MAIPRKQYKIGSRCDLLEKKDSSSNSSRIRALSVFVFLLNLVIIFKLYSLQVTAHDSYKELANDQHQIFQKLVPKRGEIYLEDVNGLYPVAVNKETKMVYGVPKEMDDPQDVAQKASEALSLDQNDLKEKFDRPNDMYEVVKHRLSDEEIEKINNLKLKGVHLAEESYRYYPGGELASHILGFVGWKNDEFGGRYGQEAYYEEQLKGKEGGLFQNRDTSGRWISTGIKEINYAQDGDNLVLTVDRVIQYETEKILKAAIQKYQVDRGTIIVEESQTGKILAMASYPDFNPNEYGAVENMEAFRNLAISDSYECGSVFKAVTMAAALDDGKVNSQTTYTDTGKVSEAGYTIQNSDYKANGLQTMTQVLEKSLNTGVIFAEKLMGNKTFADYVKRFGFGEPTKVDMLGEAQGNIKNLENLKSNIQFFTASFGQGISVTPIQLISAYNAIANGGVLMKPYLVEKILNSNGNVETIEPQEVRRVISQKTANEISQMLRSVVTDGHGKQADVPGYLVAGKTGTAQVAKSGAKGYEEGKNIGSFAGFAPLNNPKFTVLVRLDNPKGVEWAESSAAPTFGELMKFLMDYAKIEPTEKITEESLKLFSATHNLKEFFVKEEDKVENKNNDNKDDQETNGTGGQK